MNRVLIYRCQLNIFKITIMSKIQLSICKYRQNFFLPFELLTISESNCANEWNIFEAFSFEKFSRLID